MKYFAIDGSDKVFDEETFRNLGTGMKANRCYYLGTRDNYYQAENIWREFMFGFADEGTIAGEVRLHKLSKEEKASAKVSKNYDDRLNRYLSKVKIWRTI